jgi:hypothetical protein
MTTKKTTARIETLSLKPSEVSVTIRHMANKKVSLFLWGPPGISKSSVIAQMAKELGMDFVDVRLSQMDPTDLRGIPFPTKDKNGEEIVKWAPPAVLPRDPNARAIILLDEFNSAAPSVQAGAYQLVLDRKLGEYCVPEGCMIIAAGNRETDKGITFRMPTPIANRFVHIEMRADFDDWQRWALGANVHKDVVGYLTAFKHDLFQFDASSASRGFATPRSWEFVSKILADSDGLPEMVTLGLISGAVGDGVGIKFLEYRKNAADLPDPRQILAGTVKDLKRAEVSLCYALTTALCYELKDGSDAIKLRGNKAEERAEWLKQADNFLGFMLKNFQPEVTIMGAKTALSVFKLQFEARKMKNFEEFTAKYKDLIMG